MTAKDEYKTYILGQIIISEFSTTIDYSYREYIEEIFSKYSCKEYIIDLTFANYLSSTGIGIIIQLQKKYKGKIKINLVSPVNNTAIAVPVQVLKIDSIIPTFKTLQDAIRNIADVIV